MDTINIDATSDTPKVICSEDGTISIIGRSLAEDTVAFYEPIKEWVSNVKTEHLVLNIQIEYMNTSSSKQIYSLLELANENRWKKTITIKWFYIENDDEARELGEEFESILEVPFEFYHFIDL